MLHEDFIQAGCSCFRRTGTNKIREHHDLLCRFKEGKINGKEVKLSFDVKHRQQVSYDEPGCRSNGCAVYAVKRDEDNIHSDVDDHRNHGDILLQHLVAGKVEDIADRSGNGCNELTDG